MMKYLFLIFGLALVSCHRSASWQAISASNPLLQNAAVFTADPAPFVVGDEVYLLTGHDMAAPDQNDFIMPNWFLFKSTNLETRQWQQLQQPISPEQVFDWAQPARAYASQIVQGNDQRFYLFAPVVLKHKHYEDNFAIGVAVATSLAGPWRDLIGEPLVSQATPNADNLQNIDPTLIKNKKGEWVMVWGTFGELRGALLSDNFTALASEVKTLNGAKDFFEAPWLVRKNDTYYLFYAANNAEDGHQSECSETLYYACIAWAYSNNPLGPWTYGGVTLKPVSSTTSHPGVINVDHQWWLFYHTADGEEGGHFRRSVAYDKLYWDESVFPHQPKLVTPTSVNPSHIVDPNNLAPYARISVSNWPIPIKYWLKAVNDEKVRHNPLPPEIWRSQGNETQQEVFLQYDFESPQSSSRAEINLWQDGVSTKYPTSITLQAKVAGQWTDLAHSAVANSPRSDNWVVLTFAPTRAGQYRVVLSQPVAADTAPVSYTPVAVQEWRLLKRDEASVEATFLADKKSKTLEPESPKHNH